MKLEQANRDLIRAKNRWEHLRESSIFQISKLEREGILSTNIADSLKAAFSEADDALKKTTVGQVGHDGGGR